MTEKDENLSFEQAMEKLEEIVQKLETGDVPLEQAIDFYQEGMLLSKLCSDKIVNVQEKMTKIMDEQGEVTSFEIQEEE
ncbi:exodeoxyribonuclease VII small subunit [Oceanobacillus sp. FSL H7-0719]|uniref:exodeoxyribonuclease VII small subunit n=1 Tax=Oceanobacillus sp. FSL H7-0719 TaxID=2954507 RepID=UPI003255F012